MKLETSPSIAVRPLDARLIEQRRFAEDQICNTFRVSPEQIGLAAIRAAQVKAEKQ